MLNALWMYEKINAWKVKKLLESVPELNFTPDPDPWETNKKGA